MKLAVIADLHFFRQGNIQIPERVGQFADIFLLKAVKRLNRYIKPDLVFIGGDLINDADDANAASMLEELKQIIDLIECPVIVIPGNHDLPEEQFYQIFKRPAEAVDINGIRFLPFIDREQPEYNAVRSQQDLAKMRQLAGAFDGPVVSLQHVPLFQSGTAPSSYNYTNSDGIITAMRASGVMLAVSGHYHDGYDVVTFDGVQSITAPACCETPFQFMEIDIDKSGRATVINHRLKLPDNLPPLTDYHVHTHLAYCGENMDMVKTLELAEMTGLDRVSFSEHAGQLYLSNDDYWSSAYFAKGLAGCKIENRMNDFLTALKDTPGRFLSGLELDTDINGKFTVFQADLDQVDIKIGALHALHMEDFSGYNAVKNEFIYRTEQIVSNGVDILAHPFRMFRRCDLPTAPELYEPMAKLLKATNTAAEINLHTNDPDPEFILCCIKNGVKLSFGSDSHNLYEIGELHQHLAIMDSIGYLNRLDEVLLNIMPK
ncbi:MAG: metallophosphoesterase [Victivallaceae bacterium]|nr:metallophosphoesterase [Victivallaceae bacterium]